MIFYRRTLTEAQKNLDQFMDVLNIRSAQVRLTNEKLGSGAYAGTVQGNNLDKCYTLNAFL